jgi:hypothetical protein
MNIIAYIVYLLITGFITVYVGRRCFFHGRIYLETALDNDVVLANRINRLLLTGYYLINLGYATLMITLWDTVHDFAELVSSVCMMTGKIVLILGFMHYLNLFTILWWYKHIHSVHSKNSIL